MQKIVLIIVLLVTSLTGFFADEIRYVRLTEVATSQIPDDMTIYELGSVVVDPKGNIFGFSGKKNRKECCVIKWDKELRFQKTFSRQGFGPGEISMKGVGASGRLSLDPFSGDVIVIDYNPSKLVIFDNKGNYKTDINLLQKNPAFGYFSTFRSMGKGNYTAFKVKDNTQSTQWVTFTIDPLAEKTLYHFNDKPVYVDKNFGISFSPYHGSKTFIDTSSNYCVIACSQSYKFQVFDFQGEKILEVKDNTIKLKSFTSQEIEYIKSHAFSPKFLALIKQDKPYFNKLFNLIKVNKNPIRDIRIGGDRIYLFLVNDDITVENKIPTHIYDLKGKLLKRVYFKQIPVKIWKDFAFYSQLDEEDNPIILKFKLNYL